MPLTECSWTLKDALQKAWTSLSSDAWSGDPRTRSWLIDVARNALYLASLGALTGVATAASPLDRMESAENGVWDLMHNEQVALFYPRWNLAPADLALRSKFLQQAILARYLELPLALEVGRAEEEYSNALLAAIRLQSIAEGGASDERFGRAMKLYATRHMQALNENWEDYQLMKAAAGGLDLSNA